MIPRGGRILGEVEEYFIETLVPGEAAAGSVADTGCKMEQPA